MNKITCDEKYICSLFESGKSLHKLEKETGISRPSLSKIIKRNEIQINTCKTTYETEQKILNLFNLGFSSRKIKKILHTTNGVIKRVLIKNNKKPNSCGIKRKYSIPKRDELQELYYKNNVKFCSIFLTLKSKLLEIG